MTVNSPGQGSSYSGGLSAGQARTIRRQENKKRPREKASGNDSRRGGRLSAPRPQTVRESGHSADTNELSLSPIFGLSENDFHTVRESWNSSPENRHEQKFIRFAAKSTPTTTKLDTHDHKAVEELSLRDHRSIWSQSTRNWRGTKNAQKLGHELDSPRSMNSWGIGWNPLVESLNSHPSSS
jgi:hypothetical protein